MPDEFAPDELLSAVALSSLANRKARTLARLRRRDLPPSVFLPAALSPGREGAGGGVRPSVRCAARANA
jgi:hypothetical protein